MKVTEMIFLDNESLWEAIEKYSSVSGARDYAIYKGLDGPAMDAVEVEYYEARGVLRLMLGLPNESEKNPSVWDFYGDKKQGQSRRDDISIPKIPKKED